MCSTCTLFYFAFLVETKRSYKSVCPSVRRLVTLSLFGLLGATYGRVSVLVQVKIVLDHLHIGANFEFLATVANVFINAMNDAAENVTMLKV